MIAMYRENGDGNIDVWILVVDMVEGSVILLATAARTYCGNCPYPVNTSLLSLSISNSQGFSP